MNAKHPLPALLLAALLAGCSSQPQTTQTGPSAEPQPETKEAKAPELATGRVAFQKLYVSARLWAPDAKPFGMQSQPTKAASGREGKAGVWRGSFASVVRRSVKPYVWSGVDPPDAPERGINAAPEDTFNPSNVSTQPFDFAFLKIDSDKAYEVAQSKGGKQIIDKAADQPITYKLDFDPHKSQLTWHVIYGTDEMDAKLRVAVDATTGEFLRRER